MRGGKINQAPFFLKTGDGKTEPLSIVLIQRDRKTEAGLPEKLLFRFKIFMIKTLYFSNAKRILVGRCEGIWQSRWS